MGRSQNTYERLKYMKKKYICLVCLFFSLIVPIPANAEFISDWAAEHYENASETGLICYSVVSGDMKGNITRKEMCELAVALYDCLGGNKTEEKLSFSDCDNEDVLRAYGLGIVSGVNETEFEPDRAVTREEMSKILVKTLMEAEVPVSLSAGDTKFIEKFSDKNSISSWAENSMIFLVKNDIISGISDKLLMPSANTTREQAIVIVNRIYSKFCDNKKTLEIPRIISVINDNGINISWNKLDESIMYRVILKKNNEFIFDLITFENNAVINNVEFDRDISVVVEAVMEDGKSVFSMPYELSDTNNNTNIPAETDLKIQNEYIDLDKIGNTNTNSVDYKYNRVFDGGEPFADENTAIENMTDIEVDVWNISDNGEKVAGKMTITVNKNLAEDVKNIFKEIFEGKEKFPIKSCSGYSWRKSSSGRMSQHSYGTCIDVNPNENYYISSSGEVLSGSYWKPYEDPYSITAEGEVVKIFEKYGFAWGATAWGEGHARDYMHFTYLGN